MNTHNQPMKTKTITLPVEVWETILQAVGDMEDEGYFGNGWKSEKLSKAEAALCIALDEAPEE